MTARICPKCEPNTALRRQLVSGPGGAGHVEIDQCGGCRGVWLDGGEIALLHALRALVPDMYGGAAWKKDLKPALCPACPEHPGLQRVSIGAFGIDRCTRCQGLWFDGGELGSVLSGAGYDQLVLALERKATKA